MKAEKKKIAIITGASAGLGKEFARQMEKKYFIDEVWLIARRESPLRELAKEFKKSVGVPIALDLTNQGDIKELQKRLETEEPEVMFLVNNAGYGKIGPFESLGLEEQLQMIDLNVRTLTELSYICLPFMNEGANLVQVASSIAYAPAPFFAVYAATKSYVLSFSNALNYELRERGIHVLAVCPGPVETEFFSVAQKSELSKGSSSEAKPFNEGLMAKPEQVVARALKDLDKKKMKSIYGLPIKFFTTFVSFIPKEIVLKALSQRNKRG